LESGSLYRSKWIAVLNDQLPKAAGFFKHCIRCSIVHESVGTGLCSFTGAVAHHYLDDRLRSFSVTIALLVISCALFILSVSCICETVSGCPMPCTYVTSQKQQTLSSCESLVV